ncbi:MAG TPA: type II toxin-antitoxin system RelE/ParE family toxin [Lacipirellulaceae bacterium]|nr:type II toxin-antitoxin system RelE/ParE family toxin [Lacipirellulaceae bacterium]
MPPTDVVYYTETDGSVPVDEWLVELRRRDQRAAEKCLAQIGLLRRMGHELRRPIADYLRDGVYELRARVGRSQHRILYFFYRREFAVLVHALTKERKVPPKEIERAIMRMKFFKEDPARHTYREESSDG